MQAVRVGAELVGKELERYEPTGVTVLLGSPRARGFLVDGHGVFFDVEVPDMNQSVIWSVMVTQRDRQVGNALESLATALRAMPEGAPMQQAQKALQTLSSTVERDARTRRSSPAGAGPGCGAVDPAGSAQALSGRRHRRRRRRDARLQRANEPRSRRMADSGGARQRRRRSVRSRACRRSTTITVRVKGSDLAMYHSDPARRAEIREKVKADAKVF